MKRDVTIGGGEPFFGEFVTCRDIGGGGGVGGGGKKVNSINREICYYKCIPLYRSVKLNAPGEFEYYFFYKNSVYKNVRHSFRRKIYIYTHWF